MMFLPHYVENFITAIIFINRRAKRRGRLQIDHLQLLLVFPTFARFVIDVLEVYLPLTSLFFFI